MIVAATHIPPLGLEGVRTLDMAACSLEAA